MQTVQNGCSSKHRQTNGPKRAEKRGFVWFRTPSNIDNIVKGEGCSANFSIFFLESHKKLLAACSCTSDSLFVSVCVATASLTCPNVSCSPVLRSLGVLMLRTCTSLDNNADDDSSYSAIFFHTERTIFLFFMETIYKWC